MPSHQVRQKRCLHPAPPTALQNAIQIRVEFTLFFVVQPVRELDSCSAACKLAGVVKTQQLLLQVVVAQLAAHSCRTHWTLRSGLRTAFTNRVAAVALVNRNCEELLTAGALQTVGKRLIGNQLNFFHLFVAALLFEVGQVITVLLRRR